MTSIDLAKCAANTTTLRTPRVTISATGEAVCEKCGPLSDVRTRREKLAHLETHLNGDDLVVDREPSR